MHSLETLEQTYLNFLNTFNIDIILKRFNNHYPSALSCIDDVFGTWVDHVINESEELDEEEIEHVAEQLYDIIELEHELKNKLLDKWIDK